MNGQLQVSEDVLKLNPGLVKALSTVPASKYHNARTDAKGLRFQSGHEATVVSGLMLMEERKQIFALRLQVRFPLQGGNAYVADAVYLDLDLQPHIVDAKGVLTKEFKIKSRLFREKYKQEIELL